VRARRRARAARPLSRARVRGASTPLPRRQTARHVPRLVYRSRSIARPGALTRGGDLTLP
jgi:hypothetical protein